MHRFALILLSGSICFAQSELKFEKVTDEPMLAVSGVGAAWADYDNDGLPDLFVGTTVGNPTQFGANILYRNLGNGKLIGVPATSFPADGGVISAAWADYDNDGWPDLYGGKLNNDLLYHNNGDGSFTKITNSVTTDGRSTVGAGWADYDHDGLVDLISINEGQPNSLFHNEGNGAFTPVANTPVSTSSSSQAAAWADYDNDGLPDLFVANYQNNRCFLYHNDGGGKFTRIQNGALVATQGKFSAAAWGDYDNDGFLDLVVCSYGPNNALYHNNGDGTFTKVIDSPVTKDPSHSYSAVWGDYDNDGWLDLFISNGSSIRNALYHNNGNGTFTRATSDTFSSGNAEGRTAAWVDYDRDGFLDLWVANTFGNANALYRNTGNKKHWLDVRLEGRSSNRAALGAKIRVASVFNGQLISQLREIAGAGLDAHFGAGDATQIVTLEVTWPSGIRQTLTNVQIDRTLTVIEPSSLVVRRARAGEFTFTIMCVSTNSCTIERSDDLVHWTLWDTVAKLDRSKMITDAVLETSMKFYRVREEPTPGASND